MRAARSGPAILHALLLLLLTLPAAAQGGVGWLRYAIPPDPPRYHGLPHAVVLLGNAAGDIAPEEQTAADELDRGLGHMVAGTDVVLHRFDLRQDAIILGTTDALHRARIGRHLHGWTEKPLPEEGFRIVHLRRGIREWYVLQGGSPRAELWAAFRFAALVAEDQQLPQELIDAPQLPLRALDMGSAAALLPLLESSQSGSEAFTTRNTFLRLLASVGLNSVTATATPAQAASLAEQLRPYGIRLQPNPPAARDIVLQDRPLLPLASPSFGAQPTVPQAAVLHILPVQPNVLAYPAPAWAAQLHTPERGLHGDTTLADLLAAAGGGVSGTLTVDQATQLLQQPLLHANLYSFGRLLWSPTLSPEAITEEWARQTWGDDARVYATAVHILLESGNAARDTAAPLGMPWMTDTAGNPDPARLSQGANAPFANGSTIGTGRTGDNTYETTQYPDAVAAALADPARCPEPVLLLFHQLPWRYTMPDGKPLAQHLYDTVFAGAAAAGNALDAWETTHGLVDGPRYGAVHAFLQQAAMHTDIVRDATTEWLQTTGGVPDALGFAGSHPGRTVATAMQRSGFAPATSGTVAQPGDAPESTTLPCLRDCTATLRFQREANVYRVTVAYRHGSGNSSFSLVVNGEVKNTWTAAAAGEALPGFAQPATMERFIVNGVRLQPGDTVSVHAAVLTGATASLDFVEITRDPRWN